MHNLQMLLMVTNYVCVANAVGNVANSTKNILGGNAKVDQNGTYHHD